MKEKIYKVVFTQEEVDALWLLANKISGNPYETHRDVFSGTKTSIYERFTKFVTPSIMSEYSGNPSKYCSGEITFLK